MYLCNYVPVTASLVVNVEIRKRDHLPTKRFFLRHLRSGGKVVKLLKQFLKIDDFGEVQENIILSKMFDQI
jgi:hypothetical protein